MKKVLGSRFWVLGLAGLVFLLYAACFAEKTTDPYAWDFGKIKPGKIVSHTFSLKNESNKTLNITAVNTSCGCATSEVKKKVLLPQEATELEVKFDAKGYSGAVQQFVYVNTDNLDKPVIRFIIKANVISNK